MSIPMRLDISGSDTRPKSSYPFVLVLVLVLDVIGIADGQDKGPKSKAKANNIALELQQSIGT